MGVWNVVRTIKRNVMLAHWSRYSLYELGNINTYSHKDSQDKKGSQTYDLEPVYSSYLDILHPLDL